MTTTSPACNRRILVIDDNLAIHDDFRRALEGKSEVFLVPTYTASTFRKKLDDLRNRSILKFDQFETQSVELKSEKGVVQLAKENDRWWIGTRCCKSW